MIYFCCLWVRLYDHVIYAVACRGALRMNEVRGHYATLFVEEGLTTTNGEDNRSRIMNQSEAVARSDNDCQKHSLTDKDQGSKQA